MLKLVGGVVLTVAVGALIAAGPAGATPSDAWTSEFGGPTGATINPGDTTITPANAASMHVTWNDPQDTGSGKAPSVVGGVVYHLDNIGVDTPSRFVATSATTGATLWTTALPVDGSYYNGQTVVGDVAVMSFYGFHDPGGVSAVSLTTHRLLWSTYQPAAVAVPAGGSDVHYVGQVTSDGVRVYEAGGTNAVNAFRLSDGAPLWSAPYSSSLGGPDVAVAGNTVYTDGMTNGVTAYDAATGAVQWTAPGSRSSELVVAGGEVVTAYYDTISAVSAQGCGTATCSARWTTSLPDCALYSDVGGVDAQTGYVVYDSSASRTSGHLVRFATATGGLLWSGTTVVNARAPVRGGSTVWTTGDTTIQGFSTTATSAQPLVSITNPANTSNADGSGLAVADGGIYAAVWPNALVGFRVTTAPTTNQSTLGAGQTLAAGQRLTSPDGSAVFVVQTDGNAVLYGATGAALFATGTRGSGNRLVMQTDGNLVLYSATGVALWSSGTARTGTANRLVLQDDHNLVVYTGGGTAVWSTGTAGRH